jgi:cytochrome c553
MMLTMWPHKSGWSRLMTWAPLSTCTVATALIVLACAAPAEAAGNKVAGRAKAQSCQGCHGLDGLGKVPGAPHLAGQDETYFIKAMADYKSGARKNEMMSVAVEQVPVSDFADLAAFYASLDPK